MSTIIASVDQDDASEAQRDDQALAEMIVARAWDAERSRKRAQPLPRWVRMSMRAMPRVLGIVTVINGLIGLLAVVSPWLRLLLGDVATAPLYTAYSFICPQRPSHTWFIAGEPMAMEQRMVAMYLAFGVAGLLYVLWSRFRHALPTWVCALGIAPALIDVAISTAGIRPSTAGSRLWTGALAAIVIVWWTYPRFDAKLRETQERLAKRDAAPGESA
jgi:uncharacterized membrane protein